MDFHYALVDDLLTKEEFERRIEEKIQGCGDLIDEPTAALLVVTEIGRQHVKISGLSAGSSLFSFFGKVIEKSEPREFDRKDGEKGLVAYLLSGDDTGEIRVVLWEEKALALQEIECGDVLEIIGRRSGKNARDITALALRKATCDIRCRSSPSSLASSTPERKDLEVRVLAIGEVRTFSRRDGTPGQMVEVTVGGAEGTGRLVCWAPEILEGLTAGACVRFGNVLMKEVSPRREYSIDEKSSVTEIEEDITVSLSEIDTIPDTGIFSVCGTIGRVSSLRTFTTRDGKTSQVRDLMIADGSGEIRVVLWGEKALEALFPGEVLTVYNATAQSGKQGGRELSVGRGSALVVKLPPGQAVTFEGMVIADQGCSFIDNGKERYFLTTGLPFGREIRIRGMATGMRLVPSEWEVVDLDPGIVRKEIERFISGLQT